MSRGLVILDRDGVINYDSEYFIKSTNEWHPIDGSLEGIARLSRAGFDIAVATNQSGIGRKLLDVATLDSIHRKMLATARKAGGDIGKIVYCPHLPTAGCDCRKPQPGLLMQLSRNYSVPQTGVPIVGDSVRDIDAAVAAGGRPILVRTGNGTQSEAALAKRGLEIDVYDDLAQFAEAFVNRSR